MNVLIVSDIHGSYKGYKRLERLIDIYEPSRILVLGDILHGSYDGGEEEVAELLSSNKDRVIAVKGNCDYESDAARIDNDLPRAVLFSFKGHNCHLQHHPFGGVSFPPGDILMNGHTHVKTLYKDNGVIRLNPGSISLPRDNCASYAIMDEHSISLYEADSDKLIERIEL